MALRINTNVSALSAHKNLVKNDNGLSASLEKLSSGLRINRAADDASGMAIADSLKSQALGLGQAIRNANDGISMVQTADGALEESINIVNTIKTKAIQAAQDGQTTESRKAIQADIDKLMAELDTIAKTTSFNGQKLLSGVFTNKAFQVGAFSGETVGISIGSSESTKTGHLTTAVLKTDSSSGGTVNLTITSSIQDKDVNIRSVQLAYDNTAKHGMGALADAINAVSDSTGVTAQANVKSKSNSAVAAGSTGSDFAINGVVIGAVTVDTNDSTGALVNAINTKSDQHGVTASVDASGYLTLTSNDGRAIQVTGDTGAVLLGSDMSTFGEVKLFQIGANEIKISDEADTVSLNLTSAIGVDGDTTTVVDSTLTKGSVLTTNSVLIAGSTIGFVLSDGTVSEESSGGITTTMDSTLKAGSILGSNSVIEQSSVIGGTATTSGDITTSTSSTLKTGSVLASDTVLAAGTVVTTRLSTTTSVIEAGTTLESNVTLSGTATMLEDMTLAAQSVIDSGSTIAGGSAVGGDMTTSGNMTLSVGMTLKKNSLIMVSGTSTQILAGSTIGGNITTSDTVVTTSAATTLQAGSIIGSDSDLAKGSTVGGPTGIDADVTVAGDMTIAAGSSLASDTLLKAGTVLTDDIYIAGGDILEAGTILQGDVYTSGTNYLNNSLTLKADSVLASDSTIAASPAQAAGGTATTNLSDVEKYTLADVDVTSQDSAQVSISIADSALKNLDKIRSDLGSTQNQLTSTIANISVTRVNIYAAESAIRDVDFAEESSNFSKMQILTQASTFALSQANASAQNVMSLLQG